ncbi:hypothetical protein L916_01770 [Phytophthora nicotianae]|uniref:BZIP domain-containing protein n=1 Tax=Phytophthora nicotianae TaxID=4792 RepID=W2JQI9_PHYNI|nr:hypothetical protein L916_01770 [Phytophthora nicotianae]
MWYLRQREEGSYPDQGERESLSDYFATMTNSLIRQFPETRQNDDKPDSTELSEPDQRATINARYRRQQRYLEKKRQYVDHLEASVKRLRLDVDQEIVNLQRARFYDDLLIGTPTQRSTMKASDGISCMHKTMKTFESGEHDEQRRFLESAMRSDVLFGDFIGRDRILEQWSNFALVFNDAPPMLEHNEFRVIFLDHDVTVGCVSALLVIRLTCRSLAMVFPYTLTNTSLRDRLLQSPTLWLPMHVLFQFDEHGKVCRYDPTIDFVVGLYAVIRNYRDVANILESANIDSFGQVRGGLPATASSQTGTNCCCYRHSCFDRRSCDRTETELSCPRSTTTHVDKLSVAFLLASDEDTRRADTGGQTTS